MEVSDLAESLSQRMSDRCYRGELICEIPFTCSRKSDWRSQLDLFIYSAGKKKYMSAVGKEESFKVHPHSHESFLSFLMPHHQCPPCCFFLSPEDTQQSCQWEFLNGSIESSCSEHFFVGVFWNVSVRAAADRKFSIAELCLHSGYIL